MSRSTTPYDRAPRLVSVKEFAEPCLPAEIGPVDLDVPPERQYILRMLIGDGRKGIMVVPDSYMWVRPFYRLAVKNLPNNVDWSRCLIYLTIRNGEVTSTTDDEWHVDGFSTRIPHLPEENFVWASVRPTEYLTGPVAFCESFNPLRHNINKYLARRLDMRQIRTFEPKTVYMIDPYVVHRRPVLSSGMVRCFIRLTFTHIEIDDLNNTVNPLLPTIYTRDGVREFRNHLLDFDAA